MSTRLGSIPASRWLPGDIILFEDRNVKKIDTGLVVSIDKDGLWVDVLWNNENNDSRPSIENESCASMYYYWMTVYR